MGQTEGKGDPKEKTDVGSLFTDHKNLPSSGLVHFKHNSEIENDNFLINLVKEGPQL